MRRRNDKRVLADGVALGAEDLRFGLVDVLEGLGGERVAEGYGCLGKSKNSKKQMLDGEG